MQILAAAKRFANKYRYYQLDSLKLSLKTPKAILQNSFFVKGCIETS